MVWPILYYLNTLDGAVEKNDIIKENFPKELVKVFNFRIATWHECIGKLHAKLGIGLAEVENLKGDLSDLHLIHEEASGCKLVDVINYQCHKTLFSTKTDSPLKELLLCVPSIDDSFVSFFYKFASIMPLPN